ncbi:protein kinase domain-containing protein [Nannocystaceae bacterium ST9]
MVDTLAEFEPDEATESSLDQLGLAARAEFERLRAFLELVDEPVSPTIGRYRIERVIGRGGMGVVHLARDPELGRSVALKLVQTGPFADRDRLHARLQREARALARLTHPNVVAVYDVGTHEGELFITMEYVPGTNLRIWQESPHSSAEVLAAYLQAARGLAAVHRAGIVHRDFKPDNVLVADDGRVLVGDFGLADDRELAFMPTLTEASELDRTRTGALMGTMRYMAPERLAGKPASPASDQFELCVSLWEGLTGVRPFVGDDREALAASMNGPPRGGAKLSRRVRRALERGLARDPAERFRDLDGLIAALDQRSQRSRWIGVASLSAVVGLVAVRFWTEPEVVEPACEPAERIAALGEQGLALPPVSDVATEVVQARFDRLIEALRAEAIVVCLSEDPKAGAQLERWIAVITELAEVAPKVSLTRTLDNLSALEFDRDRQPPELVEPEVASLLDQARDFAIQGDLPAAERATKQADAKATGPSDRSEVALRLGQLASWQGWPAAALEHYQRAIDDAERAGLDSTRLAAHLLATREALTRLANRERATYHQRQAWLVLERIGVDEGDSRRIDHEDLDARFAIAREDYELALGLAQRVLDRRIELGDLLAVAEAHRQIAVIHQLRLAATGQPAEFDAAVLGYRRVLDLLDSLAVDPRHLLRLSTTFNLGLLLWTGEASPEQRDLAWSYVERVAEAGPSQVYLPALNMLAGMLIERFDLERDPALLDEAARIVGALEAELDNEDLAPLDRIDAWTIVASLPALRGDLAALTAADAKLVALVDAAFEEGVLTAEQRDYQLGRHSQQIFEVFSITGDSARAREHLSRASEYADRLPRDSEDERFALLRDEIAQANIE